MIFTVSYSCWLSLTVSTSVMESLHVSHRLPLLLAVSNFLFQFHGVTACLSLSPLAAGCLSLSLQVTWSFCIFLTVSDCCWLSLTFFSGSVELLNVSHCIQLLLAFSQFLSQCHGDERQPVTVGESERHSATPWDQKIQ